VSKSDDVLLSDATAGDGDALAELLERFGPKVRAEIDGEINLRWQSLLSVDDVMQQTYLDAFLAIRGFQSREVSSFRGWLAIRAKRNLTDAIRMLEADKRGGKQRRIETAIGGDSVVALYQLLVESATPSRLAAKDEAGSSLESAIKRLPPVYERVVRLYDLEGKSAKETADTLNRSVGAMYMLRARAHDQLTEMMGAPSRYFSDSP
jgi:RNA polymerase sigma factor (sigma-70 family)